MSIMLEVVTAERLVFSDAVDVVVAPGVEGELGILPHHAPLMTILQPGELRIRKGGEEQFLAVAGGFLEVRPDRIIVLADAAERAEEIDEVRAEAAMKRAQEKLKEHAPGMETAELEAALHRAITRMEVAKRRKKARPVV